LFAFVSKSGRTIETLASLDYLRELAAAAGVELTKQCVAMTAVPSSPLGRWAASAGVPTLALPEDVSGRFSVFTMAGLFPAAFDGLSLEAIRAGALQAWNDRTLAAELMAASLSSFAREEWISLFWFYEGRGRLFGAWLQQLWAESLAKKVRRDGSAAARVSTPLAALGTVDQHSLLQQVAEGARDKWTVFVRFDETEKGPRTLAAATFEDCKHLVGRPLGRLMSAEANATERALAEMGVSTLVLRNEAFDARGVGRLLMFLQLVVGGLGEVLGIDPFNQPGVELGKVLALQDLAGG
jgi:glucose-6-phosphate isomerase